MNLLLGNERFLFRFGVDRALLTLGQGLAERGHRVGVMANRLDTSVVARFAARVVSIPESGGGYLDLNEFTARWISDHWREIFEGNAPDVAILGGWPFFAAIPVLERIGCATVFMDCGAVPLDGFEGNARAVQEKLRVLRRKYLPAVSRIAPISRFIATTQSVPDAAGAIVTPILLGADHMALGVWDNGSSDAAVVVDDAIAGRPLILNLGRFERDAYKNSHAVFRLVDRLQEARVDCVVAILADPQSASIPDRYRDQVVPIGTPGDDSLQQWMQKAALGVSVSRWEGFNLPLAEMQWLGKPVLAFDVAAHPEVVVHPWFLCRDEDDMAAKAATILAGDVPVRDALATAQDRFRATFSWQRVIAEYEAMLKELAQDRKARARRVIIDVSNAARDGANSGVVRVTRRLARELQRYCNPAFAVWHADRGAYVFPNEHQYACLAAFNGPTIDAGMTRSSQDEPRPVDDIAGYEWLLLTETILETHGRRIRAWAKAHDLRIGAVFYDAIPVLRPDLVRDQVIRDNHASYMAGLCECDLVMPISTFSADCLTQFWSSRGLAAPPVATVQLPGEFGGSPRSREVSAAEPTVSVLCVATLEPRKNHLALIEAMKRLAQRQPQLAWTLTLIGNRYAGGDDIAERVTQACSEDARIRWLGIVDDAVLRRAYEDCTFTVYASEIEGFGMPILESLWHGKPCVCHRSGVMAEIASAGGCFTVDVADVDALSSAVEALATDESLRERLANEAIWRPIKTWESYTMEILRAIAGAVDAPRAMREQALPATASNLVDLLYPACLTADWQMNDSERLGMTAVLHRLNPVCAIEVGTYKGGSLSLLAQYAKAVFSIDIDPAIPSKFAHFTNVSFLTGRSKDLLPALLRELDAVDLPVDFVLIDGDHSATGVRGDIETMLEYVPKAPLVMMLHDGFNPACRQGMLSAPWERSPYVHWVDVDFIPGRVVEHGGGGDGEMWGGLAMALFAPHPREGALVVSASAGRTFAEMKERHHA